MGTGISSAPNTVFHSKSSHPETDSQGGPLQDPAWLTLASARTKLDKWLGLKRAPPPSYSHGSNRRLAAVPE